MTTTIYWDDTHPNILRLHTEDNISSEELREMFHSLIQEILSANTPEHVSIVTTTHNIRRMPVNCFTIAAEFTRTLPRDVSMYVVASGRDAYVATLAQTFIRLYPFEGIRIKVVATFEQALRLMTNQQHNDVAKQKKGDIRRPQ